MLMHKTTYFKGQGRQEQELRKENDYKSQRKQREQKLLQKVLMKTFCDHKENICIFFPWGRYDWDRSGTCPHVSPGTCPHGHH